MARSKKKKTYHSVHECMEALLSRDDLGRIHQLGLWSAFASVEHVKRFAALPRAERQAFFDGFEKSMGEDPDRRAAAPPADADHRLFDLPQNASLEAIHQRYRELAMAYHPDRRGGDNELMQEINQAYQRLLQSARPSDSV